jgi:hypothetical protein
LSRNGNDADDHLAAEQRSRVVDPRLAAVRLNHQESAPMIDQIAQSGREPPIAGDETATLLYFLERQRATFAWKTGGLDAAGLRATLGPSSMTLGGMLKHLARFEDDMSTEWLQGRAQLPPWNTVDWSTDHDWDWRSAGEDSPEQLHGQWRDAVTRSRALFAEALADGGPGRQGTVASNPDIELPSMRST